MAKKEVPQKVLKTFRIELKGCKKRFELVEGFESGFMAIDEYTSIFFITDADGSPDFTLHIDNYRSSRVLAKKTIKPRVEVSATRGNNVIGLTINEESD